MGKKNKSVGKQKVEDKSVGKKAEKVGKEKAGKKTKELVMDEKNVYSRAYHKALTRTKDKEEARRRGMEAKEAWLAQR